MNKYLALFVIGFIGCSGADSSSFEQTTNQANPCATRGATYLLHCDELSGGNCGSISDEIFHINTDGTMPSLSEGITCDDITQDGCTARDTNCRSIVGGCVLTETFVTTFKQDGSSAQSLITLSIRCDDGSGCKSTYECFIVRQ